MIENNIIGLVDVSRETKQRLDQLVVLLRKWNKAINLVSNGSLDDAWSRHIADSAQIFQYSSTSAVRWLDIGSGGGFPGLVVACLADEFRKEMTVTLVESDQRKATFLRQASSMLGLNVKVEAVRIEVLPPHFADVISARALAPLDVLCGFANRHLAQGGEALFMKGASFATELTAAQKSWSFDLEGFASQTEPSAAILKLKRLAHV